MSIRLENQTKDRLEKLAKATHRTKSYLAAEAIEEFLKIQEWHIKEIKMGIAEADAGQLIDHAEVIKKWEKKRARKMDQKSR